MEGEDGSAETPLGIAKRVGVENSVFNVPAHRLLLALIDNAPSPDTIASEFLVELSKCGIPVVVQAVYSSTCTETPDSWATTVYRQLKDRGGNLTYLTQLGSHYLSHLVIAFRNLGGKKTPQDTIPTTPNVRHIEEEIEALLEKATVQRSQSALKGLVTLRDGLNCLLTGLSFIPPRPVTARCAHIIPFSIHSKTHSAIEMFTGNVLDANFIRQHINQPFNALNLESNAHDSMDKHLAWGIEAKFCDDQWRYYYRIIRPDLVSPFLTLTDGAEINFGSGDGGSKVTLPDPAICNLHLTIARVSHASGASELFDQFLDDDDDDGCQVPVYCGGPFVSDDVLMRRLKDLLC